MTTDDQDLVDIIQSYLDQDILHYSKLDITICIVETTLQAIWYREQEGFTFGTDFMKKAYEYRYWLQRCSENPRYLEYAKYIGEGVYTDLVPKERYFSNLG